MKTFLDLGSGDGYLCSEVAVHYPSVKVCGIEFYKKHADKGKAACSGLVNTEMIDGCFVASAAGKKKVLEVLHIRGTVLYMCNTNFDESVCQALAQRFQDFAVPGTLLISLESVKGLGMPMLKVKQPPHAWFEGWKPQEVFIYKKTEEEGPVRTLNRAMLEECPACEECEGSFSEFPGFVLTQLSPGCFGFDELE